MIIYVPGLDGTGRLFFKQSPRLSIGHRVVTFRSRDGGRFTYEDLTDDLAAIIRDLGERQATIIGESFGELFSFFGSEPEQQFFGDFL